MNQMYGKVWTAQYGWAMDDLTKNGFVKVHGNKLPPTDDYALNADGIWILPNKTHADISTARKDRYCAETDELKAMISKDSLMGEDVTELQAEFRERVARIKRDLPFPVTASYYNPVGVITTP